MAKHRVTLVELASEMGSYSVVHLGAIRRGERRPNDLTKMAIEGATRRIEETRDVDPKKLRGIKVGDWFVPSEIEKIRRVSPRSR